jgi:hypothetical protein
VDAFGRNGDSGEEKRMVSGLFGLGMDLKATRRGDVRAHELMVGWAHSMKRVRVLSALLIALALGAGGFWHTEGLGLLSSGTHFFPLDHAPHAPFVPEKEHRCLACALALSSGPLPSPIYLVPPDIRHLESVAAEAPISLTPAPERTGRSPPVRSV